MPNDYFKYEAAFFKEVQTDCEFAMLEGGGLDKKEDKSGVYYEFKQILPGISPIRIVTPQGVQAEIRVFELSKTLESKKERKNR